MISERLFQIVAQRDDFARPGPKLVEKLFRVLQSIVDPHAHSACARRKVHQKLGGCNEVGGIFAIGKGQIEPHTRCKPPKQLNLLFWISFSRNLSLDPLQVPVAKLREVVEGDFRSLGSLPDKQPESLHY